MSDRLPPKVLSRVQIPSSSTQKEVEKAVIGFFNLLDDMFQEFEGKFYCKREHYRVDILCIDPELRRLDCYGCGIYDGEVISDS